MFYVKIEQIQIDEMIESDKYESIHFMVFDSNISHNYSTTI